MDDPTFNGLHSRHHDDEIQFNAFGMLDEARGFGLQAPRTRLPRRPLRPLVKVKDRKHPAFSRVQDQF
jgi:hypothetical protein